MTDIFINERSFNGHVQPHRIEVVMGDFKQALKSLRRSCGANAEVVVHSSFSSRPLMHNLTFIGWLDREEKRRNDDAADPNSQQYTGLLLQLLGQGPYAEELLAEQPHLCFFADADHNDTALAAAACSGGIVISLGDQETYPDGLLTVQLITETANTETVDVGHFVSLLAARHCRRRYVPNPKHYPLRAKGNHTPMPLDRAYDPFDDQKAQALRDPNADPYDTTVQELLDNALPVGKQLYARTYQQRTETLYEFQSDNVGGFHGYPVPGTEVPGDVLKRLRTGE